MIKENERFEVVYRQGHVKVTEILIDKKTGVHYIYHKDGNSGGLTPLLGSDGKPVVSSASYYED